MLESRRHFAQHLVFPGPCGHLWDDLLNHTSQDINERWICKQTTIDDRLDTHLCTIIEDCLRAMVTQGEAVTEGLADMCRQPSKTATQEDQTYMQAEDAVMQAFMQAGMPPHIHAA